MDYILYNEALKDLWNGNKYLDKEGRLFSLYHITPSSCTLYYDGGYSDDNSPFNSITLSVKLDALKYFIEHGQLTWVASSIYEPWVRESDMLVINNETFYVDDVISMSESLLLNSETGCDMYDFYELDVIVNNSPELMKESLLRERSELND